MNVLLGASALCEVGGRTTGWRAALSRITDSEVRAVERELASQPSGAHKHLGPCPPAVRMIIAYASRHAKDPDAERMLSETREAAARELEGTFWSHTPLINEHSRYQITKGWAVYLIV